MKDYRRNFDKVSEKYDWAIQKYFSLSKNKEQSALKEVYFSAHQINLTNLGRICLIRDKKSSCQAFFRLHQQDNLF